jgi:hypothetical protein
MESLGDRIGQDRIYLIACALVAALAFPLFGLLDVRTVASTWLAFVLLHNLGPTLLLSVQPSLFTRMFEPGVRYTGMSMAYQVSSIAGGFTPAVLALASAAVGRGLAGRGVSRDCDGGVLSVHRAGDDRRPRGASSDANRCRHQAIICACMAVRHAAPSEDVVETGIPDCAPTRSHAMHQPVGDRQCRDCTEQRNRQYPADNPWCRPLACLGGGFLDWAMGRWTIAHNRLPMHMSPTSWRG